MNADYMCNPLSNMIQAILTKQQSVGLLANFGYYYCAVSISFNAVFIENYVLAIIYLMLLLTRSPTWATPTVYIYWSVLRDQTHVGCDAARRDLKRTVDIFARNAGPSSFCCGPQKIRPPYSLPRDKFATGLSWAIIFVKLHFYHTKALQKVSLTTMFACIIFFFDVYCFCVNVFSTQLIQTYGVR